MTRLKPHPRELVLDSLLDLVGDTPLVTIRRVGAVDGDEAAAAERAVVLAKLESANPGGSVKDRIAQAMVDAAERSGKLGPGGVVVEPTSGNTGVGLALVCRQRGYRCILTMPESMSLERRALLKSYGAELVLTPEAEQMEGAVRRAHEIAATTPGSFQPSQFDNPENPHVHELTTAEEILFALEGAPIHAFVAAVGTGGTISGVGRRLKQVHPHCRVIAVEPEASATISRGERGPSKIQGIAAGFVPRNYDPSVVDEVRTVTDERAYQTKRDIGRLEGMLVGMSAGANVAVALDVARELGPGHTVITVLCDTGERYFSLDEYFSGK